MSNGVMSNIPVPNGVSVKVLESSINLIVLSVSWTIEVVTLKAVLQNEFDRTILFI